MKQAIVVIGLAVVLGIVTTSTAEAVSCGDTIGPGGTVTLTADLGPCAGADALTLIGPVTVDLAGHTVTCDGGGTGIMIEGRAAVLKNGRVTDCTDGVRVGGVGSHQVRNAYAEGNQIGIALNSDRNTVTDSTASLNRNFGFLLFGSSNRLTGSVAAANANVGVVLDGERHALIDNVVVQNTNAGFVIQGDRHNVSNNRSLGNRLGLVVGNGAVMNLISGNTALGSSSQDMGDGNPDCDQNRWLRNVFGTSNASCIH